ncbi:MAG TPA: hypothetical protein PLU30_19210 [Verrucomicrobiae bacterium]|nr:hypothetical protein [Verrucomicrobiae bacterium]
MGAWLGVGMAASAICWMLRGWVPVRWALVGGVIAASHSELLAWGHRYDGAHVAVIGAALLIGASRRFSACRPARNAVIMVLGTALMAISRPFEGLVLVLFTAAGIATNAARNGRSWAAIRLPRTWIAATAVAVPCAALMAWNNGQVTGHPLRLPYIEYQETYGYSPLFLWQPLGPPKPYRHQVMQNFYTNLEVYSYRRLKTLKGFAEFLPSKLRDFSFSVFGCWLPLLPIFLRVWKVPAARTPLVTIGVLFGSLLAVPWFASAYAACAIPSACLVLTVWLRAAQRAMRGRGTPSIFLLVLIPTGAILNIAGTLQLTALHRKDWAIQRSAINQKLNRQGGKHLVMVHYASDHCPLDEWVYNRADIDRASVVWARDLGSKDNEQLATYFGDRQVWMVTPDDPIVGPRPVPISAATLRHRPDRLSSELKHDIDVR